MKLLITVPKGPMFEEYFPERLLARLRALGEVVLNPTDKHFTRDELKALLPGVSVALTHWGSVGYDADMLLAAPDLRVIAHCAGSVARIASEAAYDRGITVLSANPVMAKYVAEGALGMMLCAMRQFPRFDRAMHRGEWFASPVTPTLFHLTLGLVGLGTIGRYLLSMLAPFGTQVWVYDPYLKADALDAWPHARRATFEEVMSCEVVSVHASKTPETFHMIDAEALSRMPDGGLIINSARGAIIDTEALCREVEQGRLHAALDVYEREWCPQDERLRRSENVLMLPHMAGRPASVHMSEAIVEDLERMARGEALQLTVTRQQYRLMTQE